jgi:hypothetical protein
MEIKMMKERMSKLRFLSIGLAVVLLFACSLWDIDELRGQVAKENTGSLTVVDNFIIEGITPPVLGSIPATPIIDIEQYTGTVIWYTNYTIFTDSTFAAETIYAAIITLTPKAGYTLTGVKENAFFVAGAITSNAADTGEITAVFPATGKPDDVPITIFEIAGVTPPETGGVPVTTITATGQYTGVVTWQPIVTDDVFAPLTSYTATITLTALEGFTVKGVGENAFTVASATATNEADTGVITAVFYETQPIVIDITEIEGITPPALDSIPAKPEIDTEQYTGTVVWYEDDQIFADETFAATTVYTAIITLTPKTGYTFIGVEENAFNVAGATATNEADTGVITAVFPATQSIVIDKFDIGGITAPVTGTTPVTSITATEQYTGTVTWSPAITNDAFAPATQYTATITLTALEGFTIQGVGENAFTVKGATASNAANSGVIIAAFHATQSIVINKLIIEGVTPPVTGAKPVSEITATHDQYIGVVTWSPTVTNDAFAPATQYNATITLMASQGHSFQGVGVNTFTVEGATASNAANTGVIIAVFPATQPIVIDKFDINGVTPPATGAAPVTTITATDQYTGGVTWAPIITGNVFAPAIQYSATITLTPLQGYTSEGVAANFFKVEGATAANPANSNVITAVFPATQPIVINAFVINSVTAPVLGSVPVTTDIDTAQYTGTITWYAGDTPFTGSTFAANTIYTAKITLVPKTGYTLAGVGANAFTVTGATASNAASSGEITAVFPITGKQPINIFTIAGVTAPVTGAAPVTTITENGQYTGSVSWSPSVTGNAFAPATLYTATITLTAKEGYTVQGVGANAFTVAGTTSVSNSANTGEITAVFPATQSIVIDNLAIAGVTPPVTGATPVTAITATDQYTGVVTWSPVVTNDAFAPVTVYTAIITLTALEGFTVQGVGANAFTVAGTTSVSNSANTGVITAVFPATQAIVIDKFVIEGITSPVTGANPVTTITPTDQYTGIVTWSPPVANNAFAPGVQYTAIITLAAASQGHTFQGVEANAFTVAGATTVTNPSNTGSITAVFPATQSIVIDKFNIEGITPPVTGAAPVTTITPTNQYTGSVTWTPIISGSTFAPVTQYTATITLTALQGYIFEGMSANTFNVAGANSVNNAANSGVVTAVFPATIINFPITDIDHVIPYLNSLSAGGSASDPIVLPMQVDLGNMISSSSGLQQLLNRIAQADKYVALDLSLCTMNVTTFNPDGSVATGKNRIVSLVLPNDATAIINGASGSATFNNFSELRSVSGANIITIGNYAFAGGLTNLQEVDFPKTKTINIFAFSGCSGLRRLNIPSVEFIDRDVFTTTGNTALTIILGITAPNLGDTPRFQGVNSQKMVTLDVPSGATGYTEQWVSDFRAGNTNVIIVFLSKITAISQVYDHIINYPGTISATNPVPIFMDIDLGTLTDANSGWRLLLSEIGRTTRQVALDLSICTMNGTVFNPDNSSVVAASQDRIVSLVLPNVATSIPNEISSRPAFNNFTQLRSVTGANILTIGTRAFENCTWLEQVNFPAATSIGNRAFQSCSRLPRVTFPAVTSIGNNAFQGCTFLVEANFPVAATVGSNAFNSCTRLANLSIPAVTQINSNAFNSTGTTALTIIMGATRPTLSGSIFSGTYISQKAVTVRVPSGATGYDDSAWQNSFRGGIANIVLDILYY